MQDNLITPDSEDPPSQTALTQRDVAGQAIDNIDVGSSASDPQKTDDAGVMEDLEREILELIGKRVADDRILAPAISNSIAVRLEGILKKGLPKDEKEQLIKDHVPPKNCVCFDPPKLNEEIKVSLNETSSKRDGRLVEKQNKITACLALLGSTIVDVINDKKLNSDAQKLSTTQASLLRKLSEATRLLADLQRDETLTRRSLIIATINSSLKEALESSKADEWLFGQKLGERLKAAKTIEKSGKDLMEKSRETKKLQGSASTSAFQVQDVGRVPEQLSQSVSVHQQKLGESEQSATQQLPVERPKSAEKNLVITNVTKSAGRLKYFLNSWKKITSDSRILTWIQGYEIPFKRIVFQYSIPGQPSWSSKNKSLISDQIQKLILKGTICKCSPRVDQFVSSIFLVPKSNGTSRLILNLKKLNDFIETNHFKLEDFRLACKLVSPNWFMGKLDLKDAYYMVPIKKNYRKYLRFFFDGIFFEFNCLPFGLNTAPYVFTKIMKPVVGHLRNQGFLSIIYLDDLLLIGNSYSKCLENIKASMNLLTSLGFIINEEKSYKVPSQVCGFLGFILNSQRMTLELPSEKRRKIHDQIITFKKLKNCKIKDFAQLIGSLVSCCPAIQYSWAHIKSFERERYLALLKSNDNYEASMALSQELQADFLWWEKNVLHKVSSISALKFTITIFSDASLTGWGVSCGNSRAHGHWNVSERLQNINYLELLSAFFGLQCLARDLRN